MKKRIIVIMTTVLVLAIAIIPSYAAPATEGTAGTQEYAYNLQGLQGLYNTAMNQQYLTVLRASGNGVGRILAIYMFKNSSGYGYRMLYTKSNSTITVTRGTNNSADNPYKLTLSAAIDTYMYAWDNTNNGGWVYVQPHSATVVNACGILYFNSSGIVISYYDTLTENCVIGSQYVNNVPVEKWRAAKSAWDAGTTGGGTGEYTEAEYLAYGQQRYQAGVTAGHTDVIVAPSEYGLIELSAYQSYVNTHSYTNTQYNNYVSTHSYTNTQYEAYGQQKYEQGQREAGGGTNVTLPVDDIITAVVEVPNTFLGIVDFDLFGINVAALLVTIVVVVVMIVLLKKVL